MYNKFSIRLQSFTFERKQFINFYILFLDFGFILTWKN